MNYYQTTTQFNCGIDLHARQRYVGVVDRQGNQLLHLNLQHNDFAFFLKKIAPWKHDLTVVCECLFCWYWQRRLPSRGPQFVNARPYLRPSRRQKLTPA